MEVFLCSPAHPRHGQPSAHQGLPVLSCCHLQKKPKGLWRDGAELTCPRSQLLSHRLPWPVQLLSLTQPHTTGWRKRLQTLRVSWGHRWEQDPALLLSASPTKEGPSSHQLCWYSRSPAPPLCRSNVVLPGTGFFTSSSRSSESPGPQKAPATAPLMWDAAGLMRGMLEAGTQTGEAGLRWNCHMHWLWDDYTMSLCCP